MAWDDVHGRIRSDSGGRVSFNPAAVSEVPSFSVLPRLDSLSRNSTVRSRQRSGSSTWHSLPAHGALLRSLSAPDEQRHTHVPLRLPRLSSTPPTQSSHSSGQQDSYEYDIRHSRQRVLPPVGGLEGERTGVRGRDRQRQAHGHTQTYPGYQSADRAAPHYPSGWSRSAVHGNTVPGFPNPETQYIPHPFSYGIPPAAPWMFSYPNMFFVPPWAAQCPVANQPRHTNHLIVPHQPLAARRPYGYVRRRHWPQISKREAATIIQKTFRGYRVREQVRYLKYVSRKRAAYELVELLIDEYVSAEVIPDLLIEILKEYDAHGGLDPDDPMTSIAVIVCEDFIGAVLPKIARDVVVESNSEMVREFLLSSWHRAADPVTAVCEEMVQQCVERAVSDVIQEVTSSLVEDHLMESRAQYCLDQLIADTCLPLLEGIVSASLYDCHLESIVDEITNEALTPLLHGCTTVALQESGDAIRQQQVKSVADFAVTKLLDSLMLQQLLSHVADCGESFTFRLFSHRLLDTAVAGHLLQQHWNVHDHLKSSDGNVALLRVHQEMFADVAVSVLSDLLVSHLDEDMEDIDQQQRQL